MGGVDETLAFWAQSLNFIVLVGLVVWMARKPLRQTLRRRHDEVAKRMEEADLRFAEASGLLSRLEQRESSLEQELASLRTQYEQNLDAEKKRLHAEAEERITRMKKDAEFLLTQRAHEARLELFRDIGRDVVALARDQISASLTPQDDEKLCRDYLSLLRDSLGGGGIAPLGGNPNAGPSGTLATRASLGKNVPQASLSFGEAKLAPETRAAAELRISAPHGGIKKPDARVRAADSNTQVRA